MNTRLGSMLCLGVLALGWVGSAVAQEQPPSGFTPLFNGRDLSGWVGLEHFDPRKLAAMTAEERAAKMAKNAADLQMHWRAENGELINDGHGVYATTAKEYGDIELMIDYKTVALADSGIYLRANPQVQIWDFTEEAKFKLGANKGSGGLWNNSQDAAGKDPRVLADKAFGEWNKFRIRQIGERTTVHLNDKLVVDHARMENFWDRAKPLFATGPIQLQTHGGEIRWRSIFLREISAADANQVLAENGNDGFTPIFDGKSFAGWAGPTENYEVKEGAIVCKPGKGGTIFTKDEYSDFVVRVEFRLPSGGNNGLAIRYPGSGDTAYAGMCELQILDYDAAKYGKFDARQYHGSAYGMAAAERGYLRTSGDWNFQEVTVRGSTIKVELNGTVILNADLSKITEYMANSPHPGKERTSGHFGFAGHGDAVEFRNVRIKKL